LFKAGGMDKLTMRQFDLICLTHVEELSAHEIQALREQAGVSQGIFARVPQREARLNQPMGARRASAVGAIAEVALADQGQGLRGDCLIQSV
jgi:putative transcriptional regulator